MGSNSGFIYSIFEHSRFLEVSYRCFINTFPKIKQLSEKMYTKDQHSNAELSVIDGQWEKYKKALVEDCGIKKGDMVLVHSSFLGLMTLGVSAKDIIDYLRELVGEEGTLILPCYPNLKKMEKVDDAYVYVPGETLPWTGKLPREFLSVPGVKVSHFPHNSLAAVGAKADELFHEDIATQYYSQGKGSSWEYAIHNGMKILYLGVRACTACTIVHYAEDIMGEDFPVKNWHKEHKYIVKVDGVDTPVTTRERDDFYFRYYCMFNTGKVFVDKGYLREYDIDGCYLGIMDKVPEMSEYILENAKKKKFLFRIPRRFVK